MKELKQTDVKVSILIPIYNVEAYLVQCLESVRDQTLKNIEIICVDDGSTDTSLEILRQYEKNDSRIKVYSKPNSGYGHTINYGLERSCGKYIVIVESDDFIDERGVEALYEYAEKYRADYVRSDYYEYYQGKDKTNNSLSAYPYDMVFSTAEYPSMFYSIAVSPWACIYRKEFLEENNIKMNETAGASFQDNSWQFMVLLKAKRIVFFKDTFYHYRIDNLSSSVNDPKKVFCVADEKCYMERKMEEYHISDSNVFVAFAKFIYVLYKWNYNRVAEEFQYAFLLEWKNEILKQKNRGFLDEHVFEKKQWDEIDCIVSQTEKYFELTAKAYTMRGVYDIVLNNKVYYDGFMDKMLHNKIIIFGTGLIAKKIVHILEKQGGLSNIVCFCEINATKKSFCGKPVFSIKDVPYPKDMLIISAVAEKTQKSIIKKLMDMDFSDILCVDGKLWNKMQDCY